MMSITKLNLSSMLQGFYILSIVSPILIIGNYDIFLSSFVGAVSGGLYGVFNSFLLRYSVKIRFKMSVIYFIILLIFSIGIKAKFFSAQIDTTSSSLDKVMLGEWMYGDKTYPAKMLLTPNELILADYNDMKEKKYSYKLIKGRLRLFSSQMVYEDWIIDYKDANSLKIKLLGGKDTLLFWR